VSFLVDAQLPVRLASQLGELGHDVLHTSSLPGGNRTTDQQIAALADQDGRVVVTKDADFRNSHLLTGSPARLLVVAIGNIGNDNRLDLVGYPCHCRGTLFRRSQPAFLPRTGLQEGKKSDSCRFWGGKRALGRKAGGEK